MRLVPPSELIVSDRWIWPPERLVRVPAMETRPLVLLTEITPVFSLTTFGAMAAL